VKVEVYTILNGELRFLYTKDIREVNFEDLLSKYGFIGLQVKELE